MKDEILNSFAKKMTTSGYSINQIRTVVISGIKFYKRKLHEAEVNNNPINRDLRCSRSRLKRLIKLRSDKVMWYKVDPNKHNNTYEEPKPDKQSRSQKPRTDKDLRKTVTTINIPRTHDGALARAISKTEMDLRLVTKIRVKVVERVGVTLKSLLVRSNP